ncbi:hypothetical protein TorRG33x02_304190 [Trema orientale]|uniref:Uncharacterized protein n=1 Tax=Trema orientale TaxID=63057 RepID=A0A2P5BY49_TREOI|nr:hypothetical protein TorRG33x02_304190 [Trema orientale]
MQYGGLHHQQQQLTRLLSEAFPKDNSASSFRAVQKYKNSTRPDPKFRVQTSVLENLGKIRPN